MSKKLLSCAMAFLMAFTLMPCAAFAEETSAEGQVESLEAEKPAEDDAFGEGGLDEAFFAEDEDSLIGTLEADEESANTVIYLDQQHGADDKDGLSEATAVKTLEKANELANAKGTSDIFLKSVYRVTGKENWDLDGKTLHRYKLGGYMIELADASASLTLSNVVIDGAEYSVDAAHAAETDSIIKAANGGTIVLKSGAILQNNKAAQFGSGILANNGVKITMENGAVIRNNTNSNYELGGGILLGNGSTFTMNGGEISGNTANGGGGVAIIGSTMVMNGGTISNNSTYKTSGQGSYGAGVYVADYANASGGGTLFTAQPASFEMNGGKITGNQALDYGGGVLTAENAFNDVAFGLWHNKSISTMANVGILKGRTADTFVPNAPITRAEFAAICSCFDRSNVEIKSDFNDISGHWAEKEIRRAASLGWIKGYTDGSFKPDQNITRAEAASMINRMLHRLPETVEDLLDGMVQWQDNNPSDWYYINMQEATNSHDFKQKGEINEYWTKLTENPNWDRYK